MLDSQNLTATRPITPPASEPPPLISDSAHSRNTSGSSYYSLSNTASPEPVLIRSASPVRSPVRHHGPLLLPKIRPQDQSVEPSSAAGPRRQRKALSNARNPPGFTPYPTRPTPQRSVTSPPDCLPLISPISATSVFGSRANSALNSPITLTASHAGKRYSSHSRSGSGSSIDDSLLGKFGFPTYRHLPAYISPASQYSPSVVPGASTFVPPVPVLVQPMQYYTLPAELQYNVFDDGAPVPLEESTSTLMEYLTGPNPAVNLVHQVNVSMGRGLHTHFWWDIRNLSSWDDFNLDTIEGIPDFAKLLRADLKAEALPSVGSTSGRLHPDSEHSLHEICRDFYAAKVNAALKVAQGPSYMSMRADLSRDGPQFVANYQNDIEKTIYGGGRGRVVGLVKSFDRWNTSMRYEAPHRRVEYLQGLSHLHRYMREHGCRYGFIMTEIELVCVRAGTDNIPYFGFLELAPTVEMKTQHGLTACLALWYLHMMAKEQPLPGQCYWKLDVGAPAAMTRQHHLDKDAWIPEPQVGEKRDAKRARGWVMPSDPWNKRKEGGKSWHK